MRLTNNTHYIIYSTGYSHISPNAETNVPLKGTFGIFPSHYKDDDDDDDDDDSYSTIDIVIIVLGTVIVFVFVLGLIFACCRLVKRKRAMRAQLIRNQTTVAIVTQQIPSAPPEDGTVQLPPYSPLPVFPDEPPPSYSPNWRPPPYPVQR